MTEVTPFPAKMYHCFLVSLTITEKFFTISFLFLKILI